MCRIFYIIVCLTYLSFAECASVPSITKCKGDDSKCIKKSTQELIPFFADGIPDLNVETLDPANVKYIDASSSNIKLIVTDIVVTGLKNCEAKKMERDIEKGKLYITIQCACELNGKYDMKGQLLFLPIEGNGGLYVKVRKILLNVEVDIVDKVRKDGKKHWSVKSWKHTFELKDKSDVKFENLFPNNELLRKATNELIANRGNDVIIEIGRRVIIGLIEKVVENIKKFFDALAVEDLALE